MQVQVGAGPPPLYAEDIVAAETVYKPNTDVGRAFRHPIPRDQWIPTNIDELKNLSGREKALALDEDSLYRNGGVSRLENGAFDTLRVAFYVTYDPRVKRNKPLTSSSFTDVDYDAMQGVYPIDGDRLRPWDPTKRTILVACRGTDLANVADVTLDGVAMTEQIITRTSTAIRNSSIYKNYIRTPVLNAQLRYPTSANDYFATGHSLGGAFADELVREGFVLGTVDFNPLISVNDVSGGTADKRKIRRLYVDTDPVLNSMRTLLPVRTLGKFNDTITLYDPLPNYNTPIQSHEMTTFRANMRVGSTDSKVRTLVREPTGFGADSFSTYLHYAQIQNAVKK
jgi:hypothetical protein